MEAAQSQWRGVERAACGNGCGGAVAGSALNKSHSMHDLDSPTSSLLPQCRTDDTLVSELAECGGGGDAAVCKRRAGRLPADVTLSELHLADGDGGGGGEPTVSARTCDSRTCPNKALAMQYAAMQAHSRPHSTWTLTAVAPALAHCALLDWHHGEHSAHDEHGGDHRQTVVAAPTVDADASHANTASTGDGADKDEPAAVGSIFSLPGHKLLTLAILCVLFTSCYVVFSCIAPFFPFEGERKGLSQGEIGAIFGAFSATTFVASPVASKLVVAYGTKAVLVVGAVVAGIASVLFGALVYAPDGGAFLWLCLGARVLEALGAASYSTAGWTIAAHQFPNHVTTVVAIVEMSIGLGFVVGPPLGGLLYELGGYMAPFMVLGGLLCAMAALAACVLPRMHDGDDDEQPASMLSILSNVHMLLLNSVFLVAAICFAFLDPTLEAHLRQFRLSPVSVGLCFLVLAVTYSMSAPFVGALVDRSRRPRLFMVVGGWCAAVSLLFMGPSPLLRPLVHKTLPVVLSALAAFGLSQSAHVIPAFGVMLHTAKAAGHPDGIGTMSCISGMVNAVWSAGAFIGPTLGSYGVQWCGFQWSVTAFAGLTALMATLFMVESVYVTIVERRREKDNAQSDQLLQSEQIIVRF